MPKSEVNQMLAAAVEACDERKAQDIRILALDPAESGLTDYFLICSGNSDRQNIAITDAIEFKLKQQFGAYPNSVEGRRNGEWILMDYVDFIVHVFTPEKRAFYGLERLRKSATSLSIADLNTDLKQQIASTRKKSVAKKSAAKASANKPSTKKHTAKKAAKKMGRTKKSAAVSRKRSK